MQILPATSRVTAVGVGLMLVGLGAFAVYGGEDPAMPDPKLTPGAVRSVSAVEICAPGYPETHRVWHDKIDTITKYGYAPDQARLVEDDDLIPVGLGGDNASPYNHWAQPCTRWEGPHCVAGEAYRKDRAEAGARDELCYYELRVNGPAAADRLLAVLQRTFASDWRQVKYVPRSEWYRK